MCDNESIKIQNSGAYGAPVNLWRPKLDSFQSMADLLLYPISFEHFPRRKVALKVQLVLRIRNSVRFAFHTNINNSSRERAIEVCIPLGRKTCKITMHIPVVTPELSRKTYYALDSVLQRNYDTPAIAPPRYSYIGSSYLFKVGELGTYNLNNVMYQI